MANHEDLYEQDFYAWTQAQAKALRRRETGANALDYEHLAEEVADLGGEQLHACESLVTQILLHFMKIELSAFDQPVATWRKEIVAAPVQLESRLTKTIQRKVRTELATQLYVRAVRLLRAAFDADEPETRLHVPETCPYTFDDVLGRGVDWFPKRPRR